ncbi:CopD family protein [Fulvivirga lutea]|uniref:Protoporphyrinogen IX oxidase n=1 Tax=Fulvivirga lutea TaxID=2810512 RepID=A0A975A2T3_9BACT|nr:CopD family protein [Fulvivirga lutea]QSE98892.1 CopD family protein [Fulvivirga lutea]
MSYLYIKALHLIFVVTWFAGLFYIVRIFIYQTEASQKAEPEKSILEKEYQKNAKLLWYAITWPSAILTLIFGSLLLFVYRFDYLTQGFMHIKLALVVLLYIYQFICHGIFKNQQRGIYKRTSIQLRIWNEVATILLVGIVFIIVLKSALSLVWGIIGLICFSVLIMAAVRLVKNIREKK